VLPLAASYWAFLSFFSAAYGTNLMGLLTASPMLGMCSIAAGIIYPPKHYFEDCFSLCGPLQGLHALAEQTHQHTFCCDRFGNAVFLPLPLDCATQSVTQANPQADPDTLSYRMNSADSSLAFSPVLVSVEFILTVTLAPTQLRYRTFLRVWWKASGYARRQNAFPAALVLAELITTKHCRAPGSLAPATQR